MCVRELQICRLAAHCPFYSPLLQNSDRPSGKPLNIRGSRVVATRHAHSPSARSQPRQHSSRRRTSSRRSDSRSENGWSPIGFCQSRQLQKSMGRCLRPRWRLLGSHQSRWRHHRHQSRLWRHHPHRRMHRRPAIRPLDDILQR